jgi:predicted nucleotidyltransferase
LKDLDEREFRDRDFLGTKEGFLFCVVSPYHPADRVISYLKYIPDHTGIWEKDGVKFKRVMRVYNIPSLLESITLLETKHPQYLFHSHVYGITMSAVPLEHVRTHFQPEKKASELFKASHLDPLQDKFTRLVNLLSDVADIPIEFFGVTGSILLDIHNLSFSDIDITIYGTEYCHKLKKALADFSSEDLKMKPFHGERLKKWCLQKTLNHPISLAEAEKIYSRKWNVGTFEGTYFSLHPVKLKADLNDGYGDKIYTPDRIVTLTAEVSDSKDSIFLPCVYEVESARVDGQPTVDVREVVSYEGLYDSLAEVGEKIAVRGKLEQVHDRSRGDNYYRVLVGSLEGRGSEFIVPIN